MAGVHRSLGRFAFPALAAVFTIAALCSYSFGETAVSPVSSAEVGTTDTGDAAWMLISS